MEEKGEKAKVNLMQSASIFLMILSLVAIAGFFLTVQLAKQAGGVNTRGETISVTGTAEIYAVPDIAEFSFSVTEQGKTVKEAQNKANTKLDKVLAALNDAGIEEKDIQTTNFSIYPKYEYSYISPSGIKCYADYCPPPYYGKEEIVGQEASWYVNVKVRDIEKAGDVLALVGEQEVMNLSGLSLVVEKQTELERDARDKALEDAHTQAKRIAKGLGVRLGDVVSFNEYGGGGIYYGRDTYAYGVAESDMKIAEPMPVDFGGGIGGAGVSVVPGENKIISNVTVVYEIR